ncbi:MAG TPA: cysteine synthase family protein [Candidatus Bathyarchaeia archaeon]|nr:cysteine synthase family protein [Candidatus Bathyarchaeia archaeon]
MDVRTDVLGAIGNTPLVSLNKITRGLASQVFVKLEYYNPTGSYKDRMALAMIVGAEEERLLKPGYTVIEYTGGSTGSSLALVCAVKGYKLKVVSSDAFSKEKLNTMKAFGADLTMIPSNGGKITPDLLKRMMSKAEEMGREPNTYRTNQMYNRHLLKGYNMIGEEIVRQLEGKVDAFVASVGTAGFAMGVAEILKRNDPKTKVILVEPAESPVISQGFAGTHHIEGIGIGFKPPLLRKELYDDVLTVSTEEAMKMARRLAREDGIFAGTSTGANVYAAVKLAKANGGKRIVTAAVDTGLKYLTTELYA